MAKEIISTDQAPPSLAGYSQAVRAVGLIFVSGQGPFHPETKEVIGTTIQEQTAQSLRNVEAILIAAGSSLAQAVSATFLLGKPKTTPDSTRNGPGGFRTIPRRVRVRGCPPVPRE